MAERVLWDLRRNRRREVAVDANEPIAYSLAEVVRLTGLGKRSIEGYVASGALRSRRIGRRRIVLRVDLLAFLRRDQAFAAPHKKTEGQ